MQIQGRAWKYGDNVNTDVIFPGKYTYTVTGRAEIARHALEDLDATFVANVKPGDIIVAGRNWGCGSSREQAATCLVYNGIRAVMATTETIARYAREHNGCNVLTLGATLVTVEEAKAITVTWLTTPMREARYIARLAKVKALEDRDIKG